MPIAPNIFGLNIAGIVNDVLGPMVFDQTLISIRSERDPNNSSKRIKTSVEHKCKGFISEFSESTLKRTNINASDRNIVILGDSLPAGVVPQNGDQIIAEGTTFTIAEDGVTRDPAGATYSCQSK